MDGNPAPLETVQMASSRETYQAAGECRQGEILLGLTPTLGPSELFSAPGAHKTPKYQSRWGTTLGMFCSPRLQAGFLVLPSAQLRVRLSMKVQIYTISKKAI